MCVNVPFIAHFISTYVTLCYLRIDDSYMLQRFVCVQLSMYQYVNNTVAYTAMVSEATYIKCVTDCVTASSMNMFKNKVDAYLRKAGYT